MNYVKNKGYQPESLSSSRLQGLGGNGRAAIVVEGGAIG